jgi:hypothetical protein
LSVFLVLLGTGCTTLPNGHRWGEDVSFGSWERIKTATLKAATDPETWVPVAGALLLSIGDLDEDLSDWAIRETGASGSVTNSLKDATDRERPLKKTSDNSFPSLHATEAYSYATLTSRNVDTLALSPMTRKVLRISAKTLAAGTAWARVEAGKHYPTDVLAGAAIGHFLTAVIHDSFMGLDEAVQVDVQLDRREGGMLSLSWPL